MNKIDIAVGRSKYSISCKDSEQEKIKNLAIKLNERINSLELSMGRADDRLLLVIAGIMMEGELEKSSQKENSDQGNKKQGGKAELYNNLADNMDHVTKYINDLASRLDRQYNL